MDESGRRKPMAIPAMIDESGRRKPMAIPAMIDESGRRKPMSKYSSSFSSAAAAGAVAVTSSSSSFSSASGAVTVTSRHGKAMVKRNDTDKKSDEFIQTFRDNLKVQRINSVAAAADNIDDLKLKISERSPQHLTIMPRSDSDVDKSADDFINNFRKNLKIERTESLDDYKDMLKRGV